MKYLTIERIRWGPNEQQAYVSVVEADNEHDLLRKWARHIDDFTFPIVPLAYAFGPKVEDQRRGAPLHRVELADPQPPIVRKGWWRGE